MKSSARKVRTLAGGTVLTGFAGATADAFALLERLEAKLEAHPTQLARACVELAKDWRTDKYLRLIVADKNETFVLTGNGDVVQPDTAETGSGITAIGSGGNYALSAALAMDEYETDAETLAISRFNTESRVIQFAIRKRRQNAFIRLLQLGIKAFAISLPPYHHSANWRAAFMLDDIALHRRFA